MGIDAAARILLEKVMLYDPGEFEAMREESCIERGFQPFYYSIHAGLSFQGGRTDLRSVVMQIVEAAMPNDQVLSLKAELKEIATHILAMHQDARSEGLYLGVGMTKRLPDTEEAQIGPMTRKLLDLANAALEKTFVEGDGERTMRCTICGFVIDTRYAAEFPEKSS